MKKYILLFAFLPLFLLSCDNDTDPGGTSVEKMAGDWWVTWEIEENNQWFDLFGHVMVYTYNTAANLSTEMWLEDESILREKFKVKVDYPNRTFEMPVTEIDGEKMSITNGKILHGAATTPSGMPADSIVFYVNFPDDNETYKVAGFRRTGFEEDDFN